MRLIVGVIGCGYWGKNLVRVFGHATDVEVIAIDERAEVLATLVAGTPGLRTATSFAHVANEVDLVAIATPPATHTALVRAALHAGCHVFVEKPFTTNLPDAVALNALAASVGKVLMVGHTYDYHSTVNDLAERVQRGDLGQVRYLDSARLALGGYRTDVNVLWDMAPHDLVIMRRLLGAWPSKVTAWGSNHAGLPQIDVGLLRLEFPNTDAVGYVRVSWLDPARVRRFTAVGTDGTAIFNELSVPSLRIIQTNGDTRLGAGSLHPLPAGYADDLVSFPPVPPAEPLAMEIDHLLQCARTGTTPRSDGEEGAACVAVLEAADRSILSGSAERVEISSLSAVLA